MIGRRTGISIAEHNGMREATKTLVMQVVHNFRNRKVDRETIEKKIHQRNGTRS